MFETILFAILILVALYSAYQIYYRYKKPTRKNSSHVTNVFTSYFSQPLQHQLRLLNLNIKPVTFIGGISMIAISIFLLFLEFFPGKTIFALVVMACFVIVAFFILHDLASWRLRHFEAQFVDAIELMHSVLQSGASPMIALSATADTSRGQVKHEFNKLIRKLGYGLSITEASRHLTDRYNVETTRLFIQALCSKWHSGGDFSELIKAVSKITRNRLNQRLEIAGKLSGSRYAALFAGSLPYIFIPFFIWKEPQWLNALTQHSDGPSLFITAILIQVIGFLWLRTILRVKS